MFFIFFSIKKNTFFFLPDFNFTRLVLPIGRIQAPKPRRTLVCQKKNGRRSRLSSTVESGDARFSTVRWGAGSGTHVAMLISVSSVVRTTLGTGTTESKASGNWLDPEASSEPIGTNDAVVDPPLTKLLTQTAQRPVWKS